MSDLSLAARRFAEADAGAERLLGYVRMGVAILLAASIITAALSTERPENAVLSRRLIFAVGGMAAYFLVGLFAVLIVRAGRYGRWVAWATAFADVALISWNVYGAVAFGGIAPLYSFALPAAFMIPLALTFGALRFRPEVQLAATGFAVAVAAIVIFSASPADIDPAETLRQVEISYGGPPNAIRIVLLLILGLIVALAVWRARRLLERVLAETEARANLTRFLPAGVAADMSDEAVDRLRAGKRAKIGVLFIDIRDFTALADEMSPEQAGALLTDYRAAVLDVVAAHGGIVDKFIGDGALAVFGAGERTETAAADALAAAAGMARRFTDAPYRVGVGVHYGDALIGAVGDARRLEFTVIGATVNIASRVEQLTKDTGEAALATAETVSAAGGRRAPPDWAAIGARTVKGRDAPVSLFAFRSGAGFGSAPA